MSTIGILLKLYIFLHFNVISVHGTCYIKFPENTKNIPRFEKLIGKKRIIVPYSNGGIQFEENENFWGYCGTAFRGLQQGYSGLPALEGLFICKNGLHFENHMVPNYTISCVDLEWSIFEPNEKFKMCESNTQSYILATESLRAGYILGTACYDVDKIYLQSLHYFTVPENFSGDHNVIESTLPRGRLNKNGRKIRNINTIFDYSRVADFQLTLNSYSGQHIWLKLANYEYHSLIQGGTIAKYFEDYGLLVNVIWWPYLLYGNWKRFADALTEQSNNITYEIYAGTSGAVYVPLTNGDTTKYEIAEIKIANKNKPIPAYIWNYVISPNKSEEFVIVGYNSPFYDFFLEEDIIFCKDICEQITWLKEIRSTFRYTTLGVTFCCSADDVRQLNYLNGFPIKFDTTFEVIGKVDTEEEND